MKTRRPTRLQFVPAVESAVGRYLIIIAAMAATAMSTPSFVTSEEIDLSAWTERRILLEPFQLTFRVPPGRAEAYGNPLVVPSISLDRERLPPAGAVPLFKHAWSYDKSFWRGTMGSLQMIIALERSGEPLGGAARLATLRRVVQESLEAYYIAHAERVRRHGREDLVVHPPKSYETATINQRQWLTYRLSGWKDEVFYVTPITDEMYLSVSFDFIDNTRGHKSEWRGQAMATANEITHSIMITVIDR